MLGWLRRSRAAPAAATRAADGDLFGEDFQRKLEVLAIVSRRVVSGRTRAERRSKKIGGGIEFADHREYTAGDDFRYIDWSVYQRTDRLLLRLFEEEEDLSVYVLLDASASMGMGDPDKLTYGKQIAAALAYVALASLDRVSVLTFSSVMEARQPPTRGKSRIFKTFDLLRPIDARGETSMARSLKAFAAQNKRRGVAIVISDFYDAEGFEEGINQLRYAKFEPVALQLVDPAEAAPDLHGDVTLVDRETGESREVTVTPRLLAQHAAALETHRRRVEDFCVQKQVPHHVLRTDLPFDEAVLRVLRRGGLVG